MFYADQEKAVLSYDISVIQWITSCHKYCYDPTLHYTFGGKPVKSFMTLVTAMQIFLEINTILMR